MADSESGPHADSELAEQVSDAIRRLHLDSTEVTLLQERGNLRSVLRCGGFVLKVFAARESDYWEREVAAYQALAGSDLAPRLVGSGELWVATEWTGLGPPSPEVEPAIFGQLGAALARLHLVDGTALPTLPMTTRMDNWLRASPASCPPRLAAAVEAMTTPLLETYRESHFVHGDWCGANVLMAADQAQVQKVVDFEGAHLGDPAEDFKWPLMEGPPWTSHRQMLDGYISAGGQLGSDGRERLVLAGAEWALDLLTWQGTHGNDEFHQPALDVLDALVSGDWPDAS